MNYDKKIWREVKSYSKKEQDNAGSMCITVFHLDENMSIISTQIYQNQEQHKKY